MRVRASHSTSTIVHFIVETGHDFAQMYALHTQMMKVSLESLFKTVLFIVSASTSHSGPRVLNAICAYERRANYRPKHVRAAIRHKILELLFANAISMRLAIYGCITT